MRGTHLLSPLVLLSLLTLPPLEARAQKSMGKTVPVPEASEPAEDGMPPPDTSRPLAPWRTLAGDELPKTLQAVRFGASRPSSMAIVKRGALAITEGDMVVGPYEGVLSEFSRENAVQNSQLKWPKVEGKVVVPYELAAHGLPRQTIQALTSAIAEFNAKTCVRFVPRTPKDKNYLTVFQGDGCYSYVGAVQQGKQELSLGQGCEFKGTAIHELMHALGFYHEQVRPDRDQYLKIQFQNVEAGLEDQFDICQDCTTQALPYDYASIMHYGGQAFTKNGRDTMVPKQKGERIVEPHDKPGLTALDVKKIHKLYQCP